MYALECEKKYEKMGVRWHVCDTIVRCAKELERLGMNLDDAVNFGIELFCVARWRKYRAVYKIDKTIAEEMFEQAKTMKNNVSLPADLLKNLPYPCIAVQVPPIEYILQAGEQVETHYFSGNFFITIVNEDFYNDAGITDSYLYTVWDEENKQQPAFFIPVKEGAVMQNMLDDVIKMCKDERNNCSAPVEQVEQDNILKKEFMFPLYAAQIVLYLQSLDSDILNVPTPKPRKKAGKKSQKPAKIQNVGYRIGATLRQQKKVYGSSNTNTNSASHRRSPIAHIRRGHFQGFWTGPRDSKKRKMVVQWVAPTYVRGQQGADTTTVFTVK